MTEPRWIAATRKEIGQREIPGGRHNPRVLKWWVAIRAPFTDDETPWCAGFVGGMLESVGIKSSRSAAARSYLKWGVKLTKPVPGCVVVFERGPRNGHVGFVTGVVKGGMLRVLGGNQGDAVNEKLFPVSRVLGYRWPSGEALPGAPIVTVEAGDLDVSRAEDEGGPTKPKPVPLPRPRPAQASIADFAEADESQEEADSDDTKPVPINTPKSGISEGAKATGGLTLAGIAYSVWEALSAAPDTILQAVIGAAQKPSFWIFAAIGGAAFYIWHRRATMKKAA